MPKPYVRKSLGTGRQIIQRFSYLYEEMNDLKSAMVYLEEALVGHRSIYCNSVCANLNRKYPELDL